MFLSYVIEFCLDLYIIFKDLHFSSSNRERDEDSETINSYSSNYYNLEVGEAEIMSKFEPYADII